MTTKRARRTEREDDETKNEEEKEQERKEEDNGKREEKEEKEQDLKTPEEESKDVENKEATIELEAFTSFNHIYPSPKDRFLLLRDKDKPFFAEQRVTSDNGEPVTLWYLTQNKEELAPGRYLILEIFKGPYIPLHPKFTRPHEHFFNGDLHVVLHHAESPIQTVNEITQALGIDEIRTLQLNFIPKQTISARIGTVRFGMTEEEAERTSMKLKEKIQTDHIKFI